VVVRGEGGMVMVMIVVVVVVTNTIPSSSLLTFGEKWRALERGLGTGWL